MSAPPSRRRLSRLVPLDAALAALEPFLAPPAPTALPVREALGRILAEPLLALGEVPPVPIAVQDGFAVAAEAVQGAGPFAPASVPSASPVEIGRPMPGGADAVLGAHLLRPAHGMHEAVGEAAPGEGTLSAGDDLSAGCIIRAAGALLRPIDLAVAAAAGITEVLVRMPRVAILVTGDEILAHPRRESLLAMLAGALVEAGAIVMATAVLPDDEQKIAAALREADADLLLLTGGTGLGASDRSIAAMEAAGTLLAHGIAMRPGTTAGLGHVAGVPVVLLPGRLAEGFGALLLLALPALRRLAAAHEPAPRRMRLARKVASQAGFAEIALLRRVGDAAEPLATGSLPLSAIAAADGYAVVPAPSEGLEAGAEIPVLDI